MLILIGVFAVGTVWLRLDIVKTSYEISQMDSLIRNVKKSNETLSLDIARLRSPTTLKKLAREKYHFDAPVAGQVIYLKEPKELQAKGSENGQKQESDHLNVIQAHPRSH